MFLPSVIVNYVAFSNFLSEILTAYVNLAKMTTNISKIYIVNLINIFEFHTSFVKIPVIVHSFTA